MAHYAFLDENNIVIEVIGGRDESDTNDLPNGYSNWEDYYLTKRPNASDCKRTSYNTQAGKYYILNESDEYVEGPDQSKAFRANFAGIGHKYDSENDIFIEPCYDPSFDSWTVNTTTGQYEAPIEYPDDGNNYQWDEETMQWRIQLAE